MDMRMDTIPLLQPVIPIYLLVLAHHPLHRPYDPIHLLDIHTLVRHHRVVRLLFIVNLYPYLYLVSEEIGGIRAPRIVNHLYHFQRWHPFDHLWLITHHLHLWISMLPRLININRCRSRSLILTQRNINSNLLRTTPNTTETRIMNNLGLRDMTIYTEIERSQRRRRNSGA